MNYIIEGTAWKCGDEVTSYQMIAQERWNMDRPDPDPGELGKWAFSELGSIDGKCPFVRGIHEIVVAGKDFGCGGKSIIHPIVALKGAGVKLVLAESFSRYTFRNAINLALPVMICEGITGFARTGDRLTADLSTGLVENLARGGRLWGAVLPPFILELIAAGGQENYYRLHGEAINRTEIRRNI